MVGIAKSSEIMFLQKTTAKFIAIPARNFLRFGYNKSEGFKSAENDEWGRLAQSRINRFWLREVYVGALS